MGGFMESDFVGIFESLGAIIRGGHFRYSSGLHGSVYINKMAIFKIEDIAYRLCREIAAQFKDDSISLVIGPAVGGSIMSRFTAEAMTRNSRKFKISSTLVHAVSADKTSNEKFVIASEFNKLICERRVLVVDDVLNTGASLKKVIALVRKARGGVVGVGTFFNRGGITKKDLDVPKLYSLVDMKLEAWPKDICAMCKEGVPMNTEFGSGKILTQDDE